MFVDCHLLDSVISAEDWCCDKVTAVRHTHTHFEQFFLCISSSFWTFLNLWASLGSLLSSSVSEPLFLLSLFFLVPPCSLIKTRLGSQLVEPAGEQRRRCSSSWNSAPHSSSSSSSRVTRTSSLSPFYQLWFSSSPPFLPFLGFCTEDVTLKLCVFKICCKIMEYHILFSRYLQ